MVPGEGTRIVRSDGTVRFVPLPAYAGTTTWSATPSPMRTAPSRRMNITVTVGSGAIAAPDAATTPQNTPVTLSILDNDLASDLGNPCDAGETNVPVGCDTGELVPGSVVFPADGQPAGAVVSNGGRTITVSGEGVYTVAPATGAVTFTPLPTFTGAAQTIAYAALDTHGAAVASTVTVTVTGVTPVAQDDSASTPYGVPVTIDLLDDDRPGSATAPLTPSATVFPATGQPSGVTVSPDGKTLTIDGQEAT